MKSEKHQQPHTMTIVKHRPLGSLVTPFDELFNGFFDRDLSRSIGSDDMFRLHPRVNISEDKDGFKLQMLAPGFGKDDLKLNVEGDVLTISAERKQEGQQENERYTRREFAFQSFKRSFRLPENVSVDKIGAEYNNGVLNVAIPRTAPAKPAAREISIA